MQFLFSVFSARKQNKRFPFVRTNLLLMYQSASGESGAIPRYVGSCPYMRMLWDSPNT